MLQSQTAQLTFNSPQNRFLTSAKRKLIGLYCREKWWNDN